jgi:hypothetical protein
VATNHEVEEDRDFAGVVHLCLRGRVIYLPPDCVDYFEPIQRGFALVVGRFEGYANIVRLAVRFPIGCLLPAEDSHYRDRLFRTA